MVAVRERFPWVNVNVEASCNWFGYEKITTRRHHDNRYSSRSSRKSLAAASKRFPFVLFPPSSTAYGTDHKSSSLRGSFKSRNATDLPWKNQLYHAPIIDLSFLSER